MGRVTVLLSGLPSYVTLIDLSYYLEYLFKPNSEIGTFELRRLPQNDNKQIVALDFRSGFDAMSAQEQLDGYRYEMPDGSQYILRAKVTNKKEYLRSPESSRKRSQSPSTEDEAWLAMALLPSMTDAAMLRASAKLDAKYKLLQKQKLIVQSEIELIKEKRKLRREYAQTENSDSDDKPTSSRKANSLTREQRSWSRELELFKSKFCAKMQDLKTLEHHSKEAASIFKPRSPSWDIEDKSGSVRSRPSSRGRSSRKFRSGSKVQSGVHRSRSRTRTPPLSSSKPGEHSSKSRAIRSKSFSRSPRSSRSRSRTLSPRPRRSRSRARRCGGNRSCSRDTESRDMKMKSSSNRSSYKRLRSPDCGSRSKRLRSPDGGSRSKRLRSPNSGSSTGRSRSRGDLLAIMPKSPVRETSFERSKVSRLPAVNNSDFETTAKKDGNKCKNAPQNTENNKNKNRSGYTDMEAKNMSHINVNTKSNLPKKNCTITSYTTKSNDIGKKKNIVVQPTGTNVKDDTYRKQNSKVGDHKNIRSNNSNQNTDEKLSKDTVSTEREDTKNRNQTQKESDIVARKVKDKEAMLLSICGDIMSMMQLLLHEISVKENITISESNARLINEKLNILVKDRVNILYDEKQITAPNACENYRKICTKHDDTLLLKEMLHELKTQEADSTTSQNNSSALENAAHDSTENMIQKASDVELAIVTSGRKEENVTIIEQEIGKTSSDSKTADVMEIIDIETYGPKEFRKKGVPSKDRTVPAGPQFDLVIKKLMKQLKPVIQTSRQLRVYVNYFHMKQVLRIILNDMLKGEAYKTTSQIVAMFRQKNPRVNDYEFVRKVAEDINLKKYDLEGMDKERQDYNDDVILLENKQEVVVISDDEPDEIRDNILYIINSLNELSENEKLNEEINHYDLSETEKIVAQFSITEPEEINKIKETDIIAPNDGETADVAFKNVETKESGETNTVDNSVIEEEEIFNTIVKHEEQQQTEIEQNQEEPANIMVNKEVQVIETECNRNEEEKSRESLKVTAITIMTSETELHSIANATDNISVEDPKDNIKEEIKSELTDAELDKILSLDNFSLDMLIPSDAYEKETPQVISVTIMTSASELLSLQCDGVKNKSEEVPGVKIENNEDINNEMQALVQDDEHIENAALSGINEGATSPTNADVPCPESHEKRPVEDEEETVESISKYLTFLCNDDEI